MLISELFVRVRGDVSDVSSKMRGVERSLQGVETASKSAHLQTGRLGNQFANLAGHIAGVHPVVGNLAGVLGNFTIGAGLTVGILAGVAAVAVAYDKLTDASRKAMAAGDKLAESYNKVARISALGIGGQQLSDIAEINKGLEEHNKWLGFIIAARIQLGAMGGLFGKDPGGHAAAITAGTTGKAAAEQQRVNAIGMQNAKDNQARADYLKEQGRPAREAADKAAAAALQASETYWRGQSELWKRASDRVAQLNEEARQYLLDNPVSGMISKAVMGNLTPVDMPNIDINAGLTREQIKTRKDLGILIDDENANADKVKDAIWGSAAQLANSIVSSLNIGGGGKGSNLGGAIGSTAGFALGMYLTGGSPIGGAIGSTIGNIGGSLIGGLFDHKKAIETNTAAVRQNTAALLQNAPSVYKVNRGRFDATNVKEFRESTVRYATRGGAPVMVVP